MRIKKVLLVYCSFDNYSKKSLEKIIKVLDKEKIYYISSCRENLNKTTFKNKFDLIIPIGGDGTFLMTAKFVVDNTLLLGVNSNKKEKEGFYMGSDPDNFKTVLRKIRNNKAKIINLNRLEARINNKKIPALALNEFYVGFLECWLVSRYELCVKGKCEKQRGSGILIGTPSGTHGWIKSAGGRILPLKSKKYEFLVREPIKARLTKTKVTKGILSADDKVKIKSLQDNQVVIVDAHRKSHKFNKGAVLDIRFSSQPLRVVLK